MAFTPGKSGNPGGKAKEKLCFDALMIELKEAQAIDPSAPRTMRSIARKLIAMADEGDIQAIKEVFNRIDGMPVQIVENLNENVNYVALMPPKAENMDLWLKHYAPDQTLTKQ